MTVAAPTVSVVIPTWNGERYINETLASVFAQSFRDFEVIVVDDGSTDGTGAIVRRHGDRVRYDFQANAGQSSARNHGAALARGEFLAFLDHDDCWEPDYLLRTVDFLEAHPDVGLLATGMRFITADGSRTPKTLFKRTAGERYSTRTLFEGDVGTIHNPLIRRRLFRDAGGYDASIRGPDDCALWLHLSFLTEMRHMREPLLLYRIHPGNHSKDVLLNAREWLRLLDRFEKRHAEYARAHPDLIRHNRAKQYKRLGRELLARAATDRGQLPEARRTLACSARLEPVRPRAWLYLGLAWLPGARFVYARVRRMELRLRERQHRSRLLGWLTQWRRGRRAAA